MPRSLDLLTSLEYADFVALLLDICNWFGGEAVSLAANFSHATEFRAAGYAPFVVNGVEYGEVREYGNFSFTRIYESGHAVPYYQPEAALAIFSRVLDHVNIADGTQ